MVLVNECLVNGQSDRNRYGCKEEVKVGIKEM